MRGLAALLAAGGVWVLITGVLPSVTLPRVRPPAPWVAPLSVGVGVATFLAANALLGVESVAVAIGILAAAGPVAVSIAKQRHAREAVAGAWPDFLALMKSRVAAGATLPDAFIAAAERSPEPLRSSASRVSDAVTFGDGFAAAMERLRAELDDPTADRVLATIAAAHRSGGSRVGMVLGSLGNSVADELRLRRAHRAALTEQRLTALVALVAPWGLLALTIATNPQSASSYTTSTGTAIVVIGLISTGVGYLAARRSAALSGAPRVFQ